ncbi:macrolide ABC transporter permease [Lewinellaceae bacterium SD302]|nr:macrolide ABC transporter permease [Lewinellaceae bacterium SD302]
MLNSVIKAFGEALHNLRTNFFQTLLSVLGIIIGVGALVAMLSLIDGLEAFARDKLAGNTSMETVAISSNTHRSVDDVLVKRDSVASLDMETGRALLADLPYDAEAQLMTGGSKLLRHPKTDSAMGVVFIGTTLPFLDADDLNLRFGRMLTEDDETEGRQVAVVNGAMSLRLQGYGAKDTSAVIGQTFTFDDRELQVVGVVERAEVPGLMTVLPLGLVGTQKTAVQPNMMINFASVEDVQEGKKFIEGWLDERYPGLEEPFNVSSQEFWLEEMRKGFLLFRIVMGLIVGIAVVVGGVGVMNVLLMSITERTAEIGIRKAVGANRGTILSQFLAESVAISVIGSIFGIILGISIALLVAPIFSMIQPELAFNARLSFSTILTVGVIAVVTGIIFGTYPARKAAGMDPVAAIQRS